jgi:hypothetical protein
MSSFHLLSTVQLNILIAELLLFINEKYPGDVYPQDILVFHLTPGILDPLNP